MNEPTSAIIPMDQQTGIVVRTPEQVLEHAHKCAKHLKAIIEAKPNKVQFAGETYLEFEDWQLLARFNNATVKVERTDFVRFGEVTGFEAVAVVLDQDGREISRAESMCLDEEENWGDVPVYEWRDKLDPEGKKIWDKDGGKNHSGAYVRERIEVRREPKPLFQLRSMAQTRASAKALRNVYSWIVVLAGYKPAVAEEMTGREKQTIQGDPDNPEQPLPSGIKRKEKPQEAKAEPAKEAPKSETQTNGNNGPIIGEKGPGRGKRLYAITKTAGYEVDDIRRWIGESYGVPAKEGHLPSFDDIPVKFYDTICNLVEKKAVKFQPPADSASPAAGELGFNQERDDPDFYDQSR